MAKLSICFTLLVIMVRYASCSAHADENVLEGMPVIGILAQPLDSDVSWPQVPKEIYDGYNQFVASTHVKYIESAGGRVVPIYWNQPDEYYEHLMSSINGLYLPGGDTVLIDGDGSLSPFMAITKKLLDMAVDMNNRGIHFPVWGVCQGFEQLMIYPMRTPSMQTFNANNLARHLHLVPRGYFSKLMRGVDNSLVNKMAHVDVAPHYHTNGTSVEVFYHTEELRNFYDLLSIESDRDGKFFTNVVEANDYPIYGTQFHPEMTMFLWNETKNVPHNVYAVELAQYFVRFYVQEARKNSQQFSDKTEEMKTLIYNFPMVYTHQYGAFYDQVYYFNE
eukprot:CAMPEP_0115022570 /NCGR_PEP_ID=MMETSP0216-20121206/31650_1 /TAXON_ID=223996 /ORGANISM="Protocruzia adherens, Strain Boccale" /LENGTH=333 /DNA_ID=CAMNT_0002395321 /DNA_START=27 /DNA_END=1028 /DNA_ORIENTATION=-